jgi:hypothetical protein
MISVGLVGLKYRGAKTDEALPQTDETCHVCGHRQQRCHHAIIDVGIERRPEAVRSIRNLDHARTSLTFVRSPKVFCIVV